MSDLIDKYEAMVAMHDTAKVIDHMDSVQDGEVKRTVRAVERILEGLPTVDAVPVRHGKWIIRDNPGTGWYRVTCSECGEDVTSTAPCIGFFPNAKVTWDYCPSCGARMDE